MKRPVGLRFRGLQIFGINMLHGPALLSLIALAFFAVLFLQSGLDKVTDWPGNLDFHTEHFKGTLPGKHPAFFLFVLTVVELITGVSASAAAVWSVISRKSDAAHPVFIAAMAVFVMLFAGQRIAKDYAGAAALVPYFLLALFCAWMTLPS